jgi:hypothetical protein
MLHRLQLVAVTGVAGAAVAAIGLLGSSGAATPQANVVARGGHAPSALTRDFKIFRVKRHHASAAAVATTGPLASIIKSWTSPDNGYAIETGDIQQVTIGSFTVWVGSAPTGVCMAWTTTLTGATDGSVCAPTSTVESGGLFAEATTGAQKPGPPSGQVTLVGLAPNDNSTVNVSADGVQQQVALTDGVYEWTGQGAPVLSVLSSSGQTETFQ